MRIRNRNQWVSGLVEKSTDYPRSYIVKTENGHVLRRNRHHLIKTKEQLVVCHPDIDDEYFNNDISSSYDSHQNSDQLGDADMNTLLQVQVSNEFVARSPTDPPLCTSKDRNVKRPVRFNDYVTVFK